MELDLDEIEKRARKATPGPWTWWTSNSYRRLSSPKGGDGDVLRGTVAKHDGHPDVVCTEEDRDFIANARMDIPRLIAEVKRLRNQLAEVEKERVAHR